MASVSKISGKNINDISEIYGKDVTQLNELLGLELGTNVSPALLLHFDCDVASPSHRITVYNDLKTDSSVSKWGSSLHFTGSAYLSTPNSTDWDFGTGNFTIDFWLYITATQSNYASIIEGTDAGLAGWSFAFDDTGTKIRFVCDGPGSWTTLVETDNIPQNTWCHVALVRSGSELKIYRDGVLKDTETGVTYNINSNGHGLFMGIRHGSSTYLNGYVDEMRISKGSARWTTNFSVPTSPYSDDQYTTLLIHADGDASDSGHGLTFESSPIFDNSVYKFGSNSICLANGPYLELADSDDWDFGSGDFTIDFWYNFVTDKYTYFVGQYVMGDNNNNSWAFSYRSDTHKLMFSYSTTGSDYHTLETGTWSPTTGIWYHLALVRHNDILTYYVDGQSIITKTLDVTIANSGRKLHIGKNDYNFSTGGYWYPDGYIDELRIVKGTAAWTSNFTPPTAPY